LETQPEYVIRAAALSGTNLWQCLGVDERLVPAGIINNAYQQYQNYLTPTASRDGNDSGAVSPSRCPRSVEEFNAEARKWLETARDPRWKRPYTELVYQPMLEVLRYLHENAYKTYIVTGGGQDFVRVYAEKAVAVRGKSGRTSPARIFPGPGALLDRVRSATPQGARFQVARRARQSRA
jgi:phosphoglycolate phosphatase-like HAD superfamily hydrolase